MGYHRPLHREAVNHGMYLVGLNYGKRISKEWSLFLPVVVFIVVVGGCVVVAGSVVVGGCTYIHTYIYLTKQVKLHKMAAKG